MFTLGFIIRDGWPNLGSTFWARILGGLVCSISLSIINWLCDYYSFWCMIALIFSVIIDFYLDQKHGEGQRARNSKDFKWLLVSGLSSVVATVLVLIAFGHYNRAGLLIAFGFFKPSYWKLCWAWIPEEKTPTRYAAGIFGFVYGLALEVRA